MDHQMQKLFYFRLKTERFLLCIRHVASQPLFIDHRLAINGDNQIEFKVLVEYRQPLL